MRYIIINMLNCWVIEVIYGVESRPMKTWIHGGDWKQKFRCHDLHTLHRMQDEKGKLYLISWKVLRSCLMLDEQRRGFMKKGEFA
jgi:hypothetical protein